MTRTTGRALWLPDVLRDAGLHVEVVPGWETRGKEPVEWLCQVFHHTAGPLKGTHPSLDVVTRGRSDLTGPLCNALPARDGVWWVVASGAANHPGVSYIPFHGGISSGVKYYALGWECENTGLGEPWAQMESIEIGEAAVADYLGWPVATSNVFGHKEIARPLGRKPDPQGVDMNAHRAAVARRRGHHNHEDDMTPDQIAKLNQAADDAKAARAMVAELYDQLIGNQDEAKRETLRQLLKEAARDSKAAAQQTRKT